ncbi:MAG: hypothetical protein JNM56_35610, partial [Planctomycetia bacterium]|nr:hypothetical protein [Planctomycetia bacterium]
LRGSSNQRGATRWTDTREFGVQVRTIAAADLIEVGPSYAPRSALSTVRVERLD